MERFEISAFDKFGKDWAVLSAGGPEHFNAMTISWGAMGTLWGKPAVTVYVKPNRYTYEFMETNPFFVVSFFGPEYREDLMTLGTLSGRDGDKIAATKLTIEPLGTAGVTFREAKDVLLCRTMYWQDLKRDNMEKEIMERNYIYEEPHRMFIGEVMQLIQR